MNAWNARTNEESDAINKLKGAIRSKLDDERADIDKLEKIFDNNGTNDPEKAFTKTMAYAQYMDKDENVLFLKGLREMIWDTETSTHEETLDNLKIAIECELEFERSEMDRLKLLSDAISQNLKRKDSPNYAYERYMAHAKNIAFLIKLQEMMK